MKDHWAQGTSTNIPSDQKNLVEVKGSKIQGGVKVIYQHTQKESEKVKKIKLILFSQIEQASKHVMGWERKGGKEEKHEKNDCGMLQRVLE